MRAPLRPNEALLAPLSADRDLLPNGRAVHALTLTYKFAAAEAGKHTVTLPLLNRRPPLLLRCACGSLIPDIAPMSGALLFWAAQCTCNLIFPGCGCMPAWLSFWECWCCRRYTAFWVQQLM